MAPTPVLLPGKSHGWRSLVGCSPWGREESDWGTSLLLFCWTPFLVLAPGTFHFHALEKEMATHSSILAWRILGTGEPDGLPSMGSHRIRHDWSNAAAAAAARKPGPLCWEFRCFWGMTKEFLFLLRTKQHMCSLRILLAHCFLIEKMPINSFTIIDILMTLKIF